MPGHLCRDCYNEYKLWKQERDKKLMDDWHREPEEVKEYHLQNGTAPLWGFRNEYTRWIRENKIRDAKYKVLED